MQPAGTVGVLALQGDVREHEAAFGDVGVVTRRVRRPADLDGLAGVVLPGGESTTLSMLLESSGLYQPLGEALAGGLPAFGTCAGLILLARTVRDGRPDQRSWGLLDVAVRRNGYGPQRYSFEGAVRLTGAAVASTAEVPTTGPGPTAGGPAFPAVFIRAPVVEEVGPGTEVLGMLETRAGRQPVLVRSGHLLGATFHPELTADRRLHALFAAMTRPPPSGSARTGAVPAVPVPGGRADAAAGGAPAVRR